MNITLDDMKDEVENALPTHLVDRENGSIRARHDGVRFQFKPDGTLVCMQVFVDGEARGVPILGNTVQGLVDGYIAETKRVLRSIMAPQIGPWSTFRIVGDRIQFWFANNLNNGGSINGDAVFENMTVMLRRDDIRAVSLTNTGSVYVIDTSGRSFEVTMPKEVDYDGLHDRICAWWMGLPA